MKVFQVNECDWYMAETADDAIDVAIRVTGLPRDEAVEEPVLELSDEVMQKLKFRDDDGSTRSFADELKRQIESGAKPGPFASTEC